MGRNWVGADKKKRGEAHVEDVAKRAVAEVWANWNWVGADKKRREVEAQELEKKAVAEVWANW